MFRYEVDHPQNDEKDEDSHVDELSIIQVSHEQKSVQDEMVRVSLPPLTIFLNDVNEAYVL